MKRTRSGGYTILETLIFLTVSSALMVATMGTISGRQERIRYTQSVQTFDQKVKDILNDVSTGYYSSRGDFQCNANASGVVTLSFGAREQGSNTNCVFLGKAVEFGPDNNYGVYTIAGARSAVALGGANSVKLLGVDGGTPGIAEKGIIGQDNNVSKIVSLSDPGRDVKGLAIISQFTEGNADDATLRGNASKVDLYEVPGNFSSNAGTNAMSKANNGVMLCLQETGSGRKSAIKIHSNLTTEVFIDETTAECA